MSTGGTEKVLKISDDTLLETCKWFAIIYQLRIGAPSFKMMSHLRNVVIIRVWLIIIFCVHQFHWANAIWEQPKILMNQPLLLFRYCM